MIGKQTGFQSRSEIRCLGSVSYPSEKRENSFLESRCVRSRRVLNKDTRHALDVLAVQIVDRGCGRNPLEIREERHCLATKTVGTQTKCRVLPDRSRPGPRARRARHSAWCLRRGERCGQIGCILLCAGRCFNAEAKRAPVDWRCSAVAIGAFRADGSHLIFCDG